MEAWPDGGLIPGFVFYAPRAGAASRTGHAGAWPFWTVRRSSGFGELSSLWLSTNDRQYCPIQIVNNIRITAIPRRRTGAARCTAHISAWKGAGTAHRTRPARYDGSCTSTLLLFTPGHHHVACCCSIFCVWCSVSFSKLISLFFGYFDPENIFFW